MNEEELQVAESDPVAEPVVETPVETDAQPVDNIELVS